MLFILLLLLLLLLFDVVVVVVAVFEVVVVVASGVVAAVVVLVLVVLLSLKGFCRIVPNSPSLGGVHKIDLINYSQIFEVRPPRHLTCYRKSNSS